MKRMKMQEERRRENWVILLYIFIVECVKINVRIS